MIEPREVAEETTKPRSLEWFARFLALLLLVGFPLSVLVISQKSTFSSGKLIEIHARMPEQGGWSLGSLSITAGEPLHLRLVSDDVVHGFKIGRSDEPAIELLPGKSVETSLTFEQPGKYTFYCTRWCGPDHWRMRGMIEVLPRQGEPAPIFEQEPPLYVSLGLEIDKPHPAHVIPQKTPTAAQGAALGINLPESYLSQSFYRSHSPAQAWENLRRDPFSEKLDDQQIWNLVAVIWLSNTDSMALENGKKLYSQNCAACHGTDGAGDGVYSAELADRNTGSHSEMGTDGQTLSAPADFTDPTKMLGASPALLQGKILRGGMGTGMPYWGPIFTEEEIWDLVNALYAFQFNLEVDK